MAINRALLSEFDYEMANTRKTLERVPEDKFDWKPHDRSMTMGGLATHLANIPTWAARAINQDSFDMAPQGGPPPRATQAASRAELLETFDTKRPAPRMRRPEQGKGRDVASCGGAP